MEIKNIPSDLKFDGLWCAWKKTEKGKIPYDVLTGNFAKSNDRSTFHNFKTVLNNIQNYYKLGSNGEILGGLGLGIFNGFSAIDIDGCIDEKGNISEMAKEIIEYCQSYTEISPSGRGIRIIFKTDFKNFDKTKYYTNNSKNHLEIYIEDVTNKFVTITGNVYLHTGITNVDILYILNKYMLKSNNNDLISSHSSNNTYANIDKFLKNDIKLNELWNSIASGSGGNESETDLALCCKLSFYLKKDFEEIDTAFRSSPYFKTKDKEHIEKWIVRKDYRISTINKAIQKTTNVYNPNFYKTYDLTDTGNAHRFVDKFGSDIKYNVDNNSWMLWNGFFWQFDTFNFIKNNVEIMAEEMLLELKSKDFDELTEKAIIKNINKIGNTAGKENLLKEAQHIEGIPVNNSDFDNNDFLFNCKSGVIDLKTGNIFQHDKKYMCSKYSDVELDFKNDAPIFKKFINEICCGNQELIEFLQKLFGYCLSGSMREQKMFILTGDGSNGKSLLMEIIQNILGDYATTSKSDLIVDSKFSSNNFSEVARLKEIRLTSINETEINAKLNESLIKTLTAGNDEIVARFLYKNEFTFKPKMKLFLLTNYDPIIRGIDNGIWRRIVKIPFLKTFTEEEQDKDLFEKLKKERNQIFTWILSGALKYFEEGLNLPPILQSCNQDYRKTMDIIENWIDENCDKNYLYKEKTSILYEDFSKFCKKYGEFVMSNNLFGRLMAKKFTKKRAMGTYVYEGIRLK